MYMPTMAYKLAQMGHFAFGKPFTSFTSDNQPKGTRTCISITPNKPFIILSVTFSPTYSFDVLIEAFADAA
ncbi:unnamed protein product, partial [Musa textilis]